MQLAEFITPADAVHALRARQMLATEAIERLQGLAQITSILGVFQEMFPEEHRRYAATLVSDALGVTRMVEAFASLVERDYFPLGGMFTPGWDDCEVIPYEIPVEPMIYDWWNEDFHELWLVFQVILALCGEVDCAEHESACGFQAFRALVTPQKRINGDRLEELCQKEKIPLRHLPLALWALNHNTGNIWLDISYEMYSGTGIGWTAENVKELSKLYKEAEEIMSKVAELSRWMERDPTLIKRASDLWAKAAVKEEKQKRRKTLLEVFSEINDE